MGMSINTNLSALNTYRNLSSTQNDLSKSLEKLSTGLRINRAADDAAGLSISEGLKSQVGGLTVAARNSQDGISVVQTAEGGLTETHSILQRMRDLAVQAGNDSNNDASRKAISTEVGELQKELGRISSSTNFNGINLLDGSANGGTGKLAFQVGANGDKSSQIVVDLKGADVSAIAKALGSGDTAATGSSFAIDLSKLDGSKAATFVSTDANGTKTSVSTGQLKGADGKDVSTFTSVDDYAAALSRDDAFSAKFTVSVEKDANGAGTGIVVSARDGGKLLDADNATVAAAGIDAGKEGTSVTGGVKFDTAANAQAAIKLIDQQISAVSSARSSLGAVQNRFDHAINVTNVAKENLTAAGSRITDVDMAQEMVKYTRDNILSQAGTSMLAQANQSTQGVLSLLR
ncbi:flagellin [Curtobacterium sp. RHCKG23]|uniref:Flagellin n=1 Tax=Curtobacterium citri TaxID=3055139 RepID=A0ABT7T803_9MICO|nr:flagellin [Curtobacterium citri]MDM7885687.1 flagellin [Curtobacterium citri]